MYDYVHFWVCYVPSCSRDLILPEKYICCNCRVWQSQVNINSTFYDSSYTIRVFSDFIPVVAFCQTSAIVSAIITRVSQMKTVKLR
jgi:hypothetical protein